MRQAVAMNSKKWKEQKLKQRWVHKMNVMKAYKKQKHQVEDAPDYIKEAYVESETDKVDQKEKKKFVKYDPLAKAKAELERIRQSKEQARLERERKATEIEEKRKAYQQKRQNEKEMMLKKTKRGQPVLSARMDKILEKLKGQQ